MLSRAVVATTRVVRFGCCVVATACGVTLVCGVAVTAGVAMLGCGIVATACGIVATACGVKVGVAGVAAVAVCAVARDVTTDSKVTSAGSELAADIESMAGADTSTA